MMFLLRMAFWLGVVLVLLPSGGTKEASSGSAQGPAISTGEAVSAAGATFYDMRHFCTRQPDACAIGAQAAVAIGHRAEAGAKMVLDFLNERYGSRATAADGSKDSTKSLVGKPSQNTLTPTDMTPAWRNPQQPRKELQTQRAT